MPLFIAKHALLILQCEASDIYPGSLDACFWGCKCSFLPTNDPLESAHLLIVLVEVVGGVVAVEAEVDQGALLQDENPVEEAEGVGRGTVDGRHDSDALAH